MAVAHQQQTLQRPCSVALTLCLLLVLVAQSSSQNTRPSQHGLMYEKNPGKASMAMIAFFGRPKATELPEARNVSDPIWRAAAKVAPADPARSGGHARPALLISAIVFAILGIGLLVTAAVAYLLRARRTNGRSSSNSLVGLTDGSP